MLVKLAPDDVYNVSMQWVIIGADNDLSPGPRQAIT